MGFSNTNLSALIGSRICHDLISPIGAINNGLELLGMSGSSDGPEMELISESVENASARIRFFRIAYGAAGDQNMGRTEVMAVLQDNMRGGRLTVAYGPLDPQPRQAVRMVFLAIQCLESAMPYGGRIEIDCDNGSWVLTGHSEKISADPDLWGLMTGGDVQDLAPAHVQFALLTTHAKESGRTLNVDISSGQKIRVGF